MLYTPLAPYSRALSKRNTTAGFTLVEFMVASFIGLLIMSMALTNTMVYRKVYLEDVVRTRVNQNIRSAIDIMGLNVRQAGENLDSVFPAIIIVNGTSGAPDQLILRRNLYENEVLNICQNLVATSYTPFIQFAYTGAVGSACTMSATLNPYITVWNNYIATQPSGNARAFAFNRVTRAGEFFLMTAVSSTATQMRVARPSGFWTNSYTGDGNSAAMYILEEQKYSLNNGTLQLVQNADTANTLNVVDGISNFQVVARMLDGTTVSSLAATDTWTNVKSIEVTMTGSETFGTDTVTASLTARLFPRNVLSN